MGTTEGTHRASRVISVAVYAVIFVLGAVQGLIGSFQYSQSPVPLIAIAADVVILATCVLCAWGTRSFGGALAAAAGWLIASFVMSMGNGQGSVIITSTTAGEWYLYGGALAVAAGLIAAFTRWGRARTRPR